MSQNPKISRYIIKGGLGRGASGRVYLAQDPEYKRQVAIKVLDEEYALDPQHRNRFDREAKAMASLNHPNIVKLLDHGGTPDSHLYLVMEVIDGPHLGQLAREWGDMPETLLAAIGLELASALAHAHNQGIIHRDLKPENVFLDNGRLVLADFGIAKAIAENSPLGEDAKKITEIIGTPGFMAPEQLQQQTLYPQTDIFACGALLYFLACGKVPYEGSSPYMLIKNMRETRPVPLSDLRPELSEKFTKLIQLCLSFAPNMRPVSMDAVHEQLRDILWDSGANDIANIFVQYAKDPTSFRHEDRDRRIGQLLHQIRQAVREGDGIRADSLRGRLNILDPTNPQAQAITGMEALMRQTEIQPSPEESFQKQGQFKQGLGLSILIALGMVSGIWLARDWVAPPPPEPESAKVILQGLLQIETTGVTYVFINGSAQGSFRAQAQFPVPVGDAKLEFQHEKFGSLKSKVAIKDQSTTRILLNWKKKKVELKP